MSYDKYFSSHQIVVGDDPQPLPSGDGILALYGYGSVIIQCNPASPLSTVQLSSRIILDAEDDIDLISGDDVNISSVDDVNIEAARDMSLSADNTLSATANGIDFSATIIDIFGGDRSRLFTNNAATGYVALETEDATNPVGIYVGNSGLTTWNIDYQDVLIKGESKSDFILRVENDSTSTNFPSGIRINIPLSNNNNHKWMRFDSEGGVEKGRIRGSDNFDAPCFVSDDITYKAALAAPGTGTDPVEVRGTGDAVYASGGADYGEWLPIGDLNEWRVSREETLADKNGRLGLPEGWVVYVRGGKFWKESPGTPMVVTQRAIVVGNEREESADFIGEILSFIGQVPVIVDGPVKSGDFLIPSGSLYCTAKNPSEITFNEYMRVIGTAWEDKDNDERGRVLCAIGIKNIS